MTPQFWLTPFRGKFLFFFDLLLKLFFLQIILIVLSQNVLETFTDPHAYKQIYGLIPFKRKLFFFLDVHLVLINLPLSYWFLLVLSEKTKETIVYANLGRRCLIFRGIPLYGLKHFRRKLFFPWFCSCRNVFSSKT